MFCSLFLCNYTIKRRSLSNPLKYVLNIANMEYNYDLLYYDRNTCFISKSIVWFKILLTIYWCWLTPSSAVLICTRWHMRSHCVDDKKFYRTLYCVYNILLFYFHFQEFITHLHVNNIVNNLKKHTKPMTMGICNTNVDI